MKPVHVICDRCNKPVPDAIKGTEVTAGYYEVSYGFWSQFAYEDEFHLCDNCMFSDPRYIEVYGHHSIN